MHDVEEVSPPPRPVQASSSWSISSLLGLDRCCAPVSISSWAQQIEGPATSSGRGSAGGVGGGSLIGGLMSKLGFMSAEEKLVQEFEKRMNVLKEGGLFVRHLPNKAAAPVWLQLTVENDGTSARIEWRSPQLILNRAVNKDGVQLDACRVVRESNESDAQFFAAGFENTHTHTRTHTHTHHACTHHAHKLSYTTFFVI
jgi:hypothetical protein